MITAVVTASNGIPITRKLVLEAISLNQESVVAYLFEDDPDTMIEYISDIEYLKYFRGGKVAVDKPTITANGLDTATVTAEVHPDLTKITFYHADTGEPIATVPVDPATHTATLQVTATTPGVIRIRAGDPTVTRLNEVVITAQ